MGARPAGKRPVRVRVQGPGRGARRARPFPAPETFRGFPPTPAAQRRPWAVLRATGAPVRAERRTATLRPARPEVAAHRAPGRDTRPRVYDPPPARGRPPTAAARCPGRRPASPPAAPRAAPAAPTTSPPPATPPRPAADPQPPRDRHPTPPQRTGTRTPHNRRLRHGPHPPYWLRGDGCGQPDVAVVACRLWAGQDWSRWVVVAARAVVGRLVPRRPAGRPGGGRARVAPRIAGRVELPRPGRRRRRRACRPWTRRRSRPSCRTLVRRMHVHRLGAWR
jgi:hypothetical protein